MSCCFRNQLIILVAILYLVDCHQLLSIFSGLLNFIIGHRNMNVGKIDNLVVEDFKDVFIQT